jgi:FAD/FMN-containing dehydrogenase
MTKDFTSWGRFPHFPQVGHPAYWRSELPDLLKGISRQYGNTLAYGNGRSYGDSCLSVSGHVISTRSLDRFIAVDWTQGIVVAEAGVTLAELLALSVPRGWFLPVVPGTKFVTLGGAIANDIHGKNHHVRGTFGRHVRRFSLLRSDCGRLECTPDENADFFCATIGGLGMTGIIERAEIQLIPIQSNMIDVTTVRYDSLADFFALSKELDESHEYAVSWIDCMAQGASAGRGVYTVGNHSAVGGLTTGEGSRKLRVPVTPPFSLVNTASLRIFNSAYFRSRSAARTRSRIEFEHFFFPLDRVLEWNRLYGPRGFQQFQCVIPEKNAKDAFKDLLLAISASGSGSFLAVMKRCGSLISPGLMSFPLAGVSLALDFPQDSRLADSMFPRLDAIVREADGRMYPAKDAHMSAVDFRRSYPAWNAVAAKRDLALQSRFWERVTTE